MDAIKTHKDLVVWRKSIALASAVYAATRLLPDEERFGLNEQLRRSAVSIASNIAEGCARSTTAALLESLHAARGSLAELETHAMIAIEQGYLRRESTLIEQMAEVGALLNTLIRGLGSARQAAHARACRPSAPDRGSDQHAITTGTRPPGSRLSS